MILKKDIKLNIKSFSYNKNDKILFKNINLEIKKNTQVGIIGESGSGKSTIIDIICGFQENKFINLKIDNLDLNKSGRLVNWQKSIGYVPQNIIILNQSLRDNILFGSDKKIFNDNKLKKLLKRVDLEKFLKNRIWDYLKF